MALQIKSEELTAAWRALAGEADREGWLTISLGSIGECQLRAGRHFTEDMEAVLVGIAVHATEFHGNLPAGTGFAMKLADLGTSSDGRFWFALLRQPAGRFDLFTMMAADVISALSCFEMLNAEGILGVFLNRVRAWQYFMEKDGDGLLSAEAETGLHGELIFLLEILRCGLCPTRALDSWMGPVDGLQDFQFGSGAIEVKTTVAAGSFPALIISLEQLDNETLPSLFLAGVRMRAEADGMNLLQRIDALREALRGDATAMTVFNSRLICVGFLPAFADRYQRRFRHVDTRVWQVDANFPRLTRGTVPAAIRRAHYELDLDLISSNHSQQCQIQDALKMTGALT